MSQENVKAFKRATEAFNRGDVEALLEELDPEVEWHPILLASVVGTAAVYQGHEGMRQMWLDTDQAFDIHAEYPEIRDLGDRLVAIGHVRAVGKGSGAVTESPICYVVEYRDAKAVRVRGYLDPDEALKSRRAVGVGGPPRSRSGSCRGRGAWSPLRRLRGNGGATAGQRD